MSARKKYNIRRKLQGQYTNSWLWIFVIPYKHQIEHSFYIDTRRLMNVSFRPTIESGGAIPYWNQNYEIDFTKNEFSCFFRLTLLKNSRLDTGSTAVLIFLADVFIFLQRFQTYGVYLRTFDLFIVSWDFQPQDYLGFATHLGIRNWNLIEQNLSLVSVKDVHTLFVSMAISPSLVYLITTLYLKLYSVYRK